MTRFGISSSDPCHILVAGQILCAKTDDGLTMLSANWTIPEMAGLSCTCAACWTAYNAALAAGDVSEEEP